MEESSPDEVPDGYIGVLLPQERCGVTDARGRVVRSSERRLFPRYLKPEAVDSLVADYWAGMPVGTIAEKHRVHRATVAARLRRREIPVPAAGLDPGQRAEVLRLCHEGLSLREVSRWMGTDRKLIRAALVAESEEIRPHPTSGPLSRTSGGVEVVSLFTIAHHAQNSSDKEKRGKWIWPQHRTLGPGLGSLRSMFANFAPRLNTLVTRWKRGVYRVSQRPENGSIRDSRGPVVRRIEDLQTFLTASEVDRLVDDYRSGASVNELAERYGVHGAVSMGTGVVLTKKWGRPEGVSPIGLAGWQLIAAGLLLLLPALLIDGVPPGIDGTAVLGYVWLGLVGALVTYTIWFAAIRRLPVTATALLGLLSPLVAAILGAAIAGEALTAVQLAGFALALAAMVAGQFNPHRKQGTH
ncbi:MAG: EamA family transporter [Micropruina sp.]